MINDPKQWLLKRPSDDHPEWALWADRELQSFWEQVQEASFTAADEVKLHYAFYQHPKSRGWVVISPGRIECYIKYKELMLEVAAQGYSVATIDHRGQGFSERISDHPQHGHVEHFDDFVRDFADFMLELKALIGEQPCYLLAHSMGGAIGSLYMASYPHPFRAAALSAPMMGVHTQPVPATIVNSFVRLGHWLNAKLAGNRPRYVTGMQDYSDCTFEANELTHSQARYQWFRALYLDNPQVQVGGPTWQWLMQSMEAMEELPRVAPVIKTPLLILQAEQDRIVKPEPQKDFMRLLTHPLSRLQQVRGSYHEILMESDNIREPAIRSIFDFFEQN
ncbi:lysophospholipase [Aliidiomarina minuta]|uniref:Lysophospholipase n=1 Tax=Aliidiomarina minuta TaxID=880057 RepID=A0A432W3J7_9GAMM|nr:alpha/beta fold hydrolase [Aliidiomarina minuta]RUO23907.1 lysophospholipase [Aliidiomarina minuta]